MNGRVDGWKDRWLSEFMNIGWTDGCTCMMLNSTAKLSTCNKPKQTDSNDDLLH